MSSEEESGRSISGDGDEYESDSGDVPRDSHSASALSDDDADALQSDSGDEEIEENEEDDEGVEEGEEEEGEGEGEGDDEEVERASKRRRVDADRRPKSANHRKTPQNDDEIEEDDKNEGEEEEAAPVREAKPKKPGILYVSRLPPNMRPHHLRLYLRDYGPLLRVYCAPERTYIFIYLLFATLLLTSATIAEEKTAARAKKGGNKRTQFTEAWVEFARRKDARVPYLFYFPVSFRRIDCLC
jgi:ESF2/ABP1 family protein